ncbi:nitroreductase/quinone reductase family protein [Nocardia sp. CA-128927]|uniref:nitroreductase/quinone reductase family protein n=1 Tax=Nocardia sp. CA-128927 TaxID=3239975 RepID=UPI003D99EFDC
MDPPNTLRRNISQRLYAIRRWMYRDGRPGAAARVLNWIARVQYSAGLLSPHYAVTLEVAGRRTGRAVMLPVVAVEYTGNRYLVSMLGPDVNWVRNVRAAGGQAVLHRCGTEGVQLEEVASESRAPILRRYLAVAPGARPHCPVDRHASLDEFEKISDQYPVFRIDRPV